MVVAFDLARDTKGLIVVGPETKIAIDRAIEEARLYANPILVFTAGCAPGKWNGFWMAQAMKEYTERVSPGLKVITEVADTFNTSGEMKAFADVVTKQYSSRDSDKRFHCVVVVKWWHAWRSELLCNYWLKRRCPISISAEIISCRSEVGWIYPVREFLFAVPKNLIKMFFGRL